MASETANSPVLADMPLMDPEMLKCPYEYDQTLRTQAPVHQDAQTGAFVVSTYELVREAHKKKDIFSNEFGGAVSAVRDVDPDVRAIQQSNYNLGRGTLLTCDDPDHRVYRDAVKDFFLADNVARYAPWIREFAGNLVDDLAKKEHCHFIEEFARPLPLSVIMHVLGMPLDLFDKAFQWTVDNVTVLSQIADKDTLVAANKGLVEEYEWFVGALNERRETPRDDLLSLVANASFGDRPLTIEEQISYCTQFLVAGNETTTATLAEGIRQLCLHPEQEAKVRADRSLIPNLVEESLRLASPTSNMWRVTREDTELGGVAIPAGSMVLLKYFSSNHDDAVFEEPLAFDVTRSNVRRHIAFGFGIHVCIGQHLSKLEMQIAWEALFDRFEDIALAVPAAELEYMPNILLRGLEEIPITYKAIGA
ncbi:MAG: cytochrome P450 [Pseudomonadota bacterium]